MLVALQVPKFQHLGHLHLWSTAGCAEPVETCRVLCHNRSLRNPRGCARIPFRWPTRCGLWAEGHQGPGFNFCKVSGLNGGTNFRNDLKTGGAVEEFGREAPFRPFARHPLVPRECRHWCCGFGVPPSMAIFGWKLYTV
jgi:hypothetical protein